MEAVIAEFVKNSHGVRIKKCCASCLHHRSGTKDDYRLCNITQMEHSIDYLCANDWKMMWPGNPPKQGRLNLDNAGKGGGRVKKKSYLIYRTEKSATGAGNEELAERYEKIYGSKYLTPQ